ncbi:MAG: cytochrome C oxidase subunit IV family protein [Bryobacteraceae bacterium]
MKLFVRVWIFLVVLTAVEVWLAYVNFSAKVMLAALVTLSVAKSAYIIAYFMHMKYESRWLPLSLFPPVIILILALLGLLPDAARAQCVMCKRTAEAQNAERASVLNKGILVLMLPPLAITAALLVRNLRLGVRTAPGFSPLADGCRSETEDSSPCRAGFSQRETSVSPAGSPLPSEEQDSVRCGAGFSLRGTSVPPADLAPPTKKENSTQC